MNNKGKINIASYKVFSTLLKLFNENLTMDELIEKSNSEGQGEFNNFVISKYINTCKSCALDIQKLGGKYSLVNFPFGPKYTKEETKLLYDIAEIARVLDENEENEEALKNLVLKLHVPFFKSSNGLKSSENYRLIRLFEKACATNSDLIFEFSDEKTEKYSPVKIIIKNEKMFFEVKSDSKIEWINPDDIVDILPVDKKTRRAKLEDKDVVEFILKGKLAKRYQPRENEVISLIKRNGDIVVTNKFEDKDELLHRLMRYDTSCKLLNPKEYVEDFKKLINDTLANYQ